MENEKNINNRKGFSGLSDLVSNLSEKDESDSLAENLKSDPPSFEAQVSPESTNVEVSDKTSQKTPVSKKTDFDDLWTVAFFFLIIWIGVAYMAGYTKYLFSPYSKALIVDQNNTTKAVKTPNAENKYVLKKTKHSVVSPQKSRQPGMQLTREVQQILTTLGYAPGPIDGQFGRRTADAVRAFQRVAGLTQDGWINQRLLQVLRKAKDVYKPTRKTTSKFQSQRSSKSRSNIPSPTFKTRSRYFTRGSHQDDVIRIQGTPKPTTRYGSYEQWK